MTEKLLMQVMTWNLWWRFGRWQRRQQLIAEVLERAAPDIVGLQEVWGTATENQARTLADALGLHCAWCPSPSPEGFQRRLGDDTVVVGNAILSRWPIIRESVCLLPGGADDKGRTALLAFVETTLGVIPFITTQLSSAVGGSALRCEQVRALTQFVAKETLGQGSAVLTGDFNAEPDSDEMRLLGGHKTASSVPGLVFLDAWRFADPDSRPWTWDRRNPSVLVTGEPDARIDYVFLGYGARSDVTYHLQSAWIVGNEPVGDLWPSDHAAVVAELHLSRRTLARLSSATDGDG
jgi:endonuclease/exonuclease/phosphatase family metal-dependent hydrolase